MIYILLHKDIAVFSFEYESSENLCVKAIFNKEHIPFGVFDNNKEQFDINFRKWFRGRSIPQSRQNLAEAFSNLGNINQDFLLKNCYGLSLSDHYWFKKENDSTDWKKINFFNNSFSEELGQVLFGQLNLQVDKIDLISPENTSDGWLKKKWIIDQNKKRVLIKAGSGTERQEPFNEVLASEICRRLDFNAVNYFPVNIDGEICSACENFLDGNTEFVSALRINSIRKYSGDVWDKYSFFIENCESAGMKNINEIEKSLCQMVILDFIIANTDRHFGNFGFLRDSSTLEWKGFAPLFDSGTSMFTKLSENELENTDKTLSKNIIARPFGYKQSDQIKLLPVNKYFDIQKLDALENIDVFYDSILNKSENISTKRRELLCKLLCERIEETKNLLKKI